MVFWLAVSVIFAAVLAECAAEIGSEQGGRGFGEG